MRQIRETGNGKREAGSGKRERGKGKGKREKPVKCEKDGPLVAPLILSAGHHLQVLMFEGRTHTIQIVSDNSELCSNRSPACHGGAHLSLNFYGI